MSTDTYIKNLTKEALAYAKRLLAEHLEDENIVSELQMLYFIDEPSARWVLRKARQSR